MTLTWIEGGLTRVPGVKVGHADHPDGYTGVTVALFDQAVPGGVEITGGGSGTRQFGALDPTHVAGRVHAVVFAGGSAFGLDTGTGVVAWLEERGIGLPVSESLVIPIVPTAIVFDLMVSGGARPTAALARTACDAASRDPVAEGSVGAGRGATVGKCTGQQRAMKGGVGSAVAQLEDGLRVGALVVVNAFGDVVDPDTGVAVAGVRKAADSTELDSTARILIDRGHLVRYGDPTARTQTNTTLALVATNAPLTRVELSMVARQASHGVIRSIRPCGLPVDGDLVIAVNTSGDETPGAADPAIVGIAASQAIERAIGRAVRAAKGIPGVPGLAS